MPTGANLVSKASTLAKDRRSSRNVKYSNLCEIGSLCRDRLIGVRTITASLAVEESCVELPPAIRRFYDVNAMSEEVDDLYKSMNR